MSSVALMTLLKLQWTCPNWLLKAAWKMCSATLKAMATSQVHLIHLRWYDKSEWIFSAHGERDGGKMLEVD